MGPQLSRGQCLTKSDSPPMYPRCSCAHSSAAIGRPPFYLLRLPCGLMATLYSQWEQRCQGRQLPRVELRGGEPHWSTCQAYVQPCAQRFDAGGVFAWMRGKYSQAVPRIPSPGSCDEQVMVGDLKRELARGGVLWDESLKCFALPPGGLIRCAFGPASSSRSATMGATAESQCAPCPAPTRPPSLLVATPKRRPVGRREEEQRRSRMPTLKTGRHKCQPSSTSTALRAPHRKMLEALLSVLRALPQGQEFNIQLQCSDSRGGHGRQLALARRGGGGGG